jgi:hypothetical protein
MAFIYDLQKFIFDAVCEDMRIKGQHGHPHAVADARKYFEAQVARVKCVRCGSPLTPGVPCLRCKMFGL